MLHVAGVPNLQVLPLQAAHGFMAKYDRPLGAFMNLESTGPGGPDYVFQQTGTAFDCVFCFALSTAHVPCTGIAAMWPDNPWLWVYVHR